MPVRALQTFLSTGRREEKKKSAHVCAGLRLIKSHLESRRYCIICDFDDHQGNIVFGLPALAEMI